MPEPDFTNDDRFDGLYLQVANSARGIEPMLDTVFSFLRRKSDFFHGPAGEGTTVAVTKVNDVLQKHIDIYQADQKKKQVEQDKKAAAAAAKKKKAAQAAATRSGDDDVIELGQDGFDVSEDPSSDANETTTPKAEKTASPSEPSKKADSDTKLPAKKDDEDEEDKGPPPVGNGGTVDGKYVWTQTLSELTVNVDLPENTRGRDLNVTMRKKHLKVALKNSSASDIVNAPLTNTIICDDSFWTIEDGNRLVMNLQKLNQMEWWDSICVGDPKIDIKRVQPENSKLDDLDGDTRQTVEKMMFDQRQKKMGLPTSEEQEKYAMLDKFKKAHPEMDFSNAKFS